MALFKARELNNTGIFPTYWRISLVSAKRQQDGAEVFTVFVDGWMDAEARSTNKASVVTHMSQVAVLGAGANLTAQTYEALKLLPEWEGATDI